jgi:hypothetical protein
LLLLLIVALWPRGSSKPPVAHAKPAVKPATSASAAVRTPPPVVPKTVESAVPKPEPKQEVKPEVAPPSRSRWAPIETKGTEKAEDFAKRTEGLELASVEDYIVKWHYAGPYREQGKQGPQGLFDVVFPPEKELSGGALAADEAPKWAPMPTGTDPNRPWLIEFDRTPGIQGQNAAIYLRTRVQSPKTQDVEIRAGSDDGIRIWVNGKHVHGNNASRPVNPDGDRRVVTLNRGWNDVLVKITQGGGQWAFCFRFRNLEGGKAEGLKVDPAGK